MKWQVQQQNFLFVTVFIFGQPSQVLTIEQLGQPAVN